MFAGHFGLAAAVKAREPQLPLWSLMLSTQLLDVLFVPLVLTGVETIEPSQKVGYGEAIIHANYTHSLVGALLIALVAGLVSSRFWGRRGGIVIGAVVFSHWLLDLLVHHADLPILPGNAGNLPLLGFGLWSLPLLTMVIELGMVIVGGIMYFRSARERVGDKGSQLMSRANLAGTVVTVLMVLALVSDVLGIG
ncbi:MAG TPA: permease [Chloroflexia bacterium]|nr:permease [Chloroflexia bacterium]